MKRFAGLKSLTEEWIDDKENLRTAIDERHTIMYQQLKRKAGDSEEMRDLKMLEEMMSLLTSMTLSIDMKYGYKVQ